MENLYNKKGMDLIKEWGFMNKKSKDSNKSNPVRLEESKRKPSSSTPKIEKSSTSMTFEEKAASTKTVSGEKNKSNTLKANPSKFKEALKKSKSENPAKEESKTKKLSKTTKFEKGDLQASTSKQDAKKKKEPSSSSEERKSPEPEQLTSESLRKDSLRRSRGGLGSSLVNFSLNEVARTHRVKSEFNTRTSGRMSSGQMFSCLNAKLKIGGLLNTNLLNNEDEDDDNKSLSNLSFNTGSLFSPFNNSVAGFSIRQLTETD